MIQAEHHKLVATAAAAFAIVSWACAQPLVPFMDAEWLFAAGAFLGLGIAVMYTSFWHPNFGRRSYFLGAVVFIASVATLLQFSGAAAMRARAVRSHCAKIEHAMLYSPNRREDLPEVFQALGCRPRG